MKEVLFFPGPRPRVATNTPHHSGGSLVTRRKAIKLAAATLSSVAVGGGVYAVMEAKWCRVLEVTLKVDRLPPPFAGTKVAFLADVHHGPFVPRSYIRDVVAMTNALNPDLVL